jgi:4-amino-4-deoxy-L-arabinose transferase-like glycosyltransferase
MPPTSSSHRKAAWLLGAATFLSFIYFYEGGGWNQNSRFDLLRAIVERHTLQIDAYHENTGDKAHYRGHYYSDKAPGLVFLAVPFAVVARPAMRAVGLDPESSRGEYALSYVVTAGAVALPAALAGVCLFFLGLRFGADTTGASFAAAAMSVCTPMLAYASLFWAHALVGACLVWALAAALKLSDSKSARTEFLWALAVGLAAGWATVTEYPAAPASAMLALLALAQAWPRGTAARWRVVAGVGAGAAICLIVLLSYLHAAFGAFRPSYSYYDPSSFSFMQQQGYMGLTYPHPDRLLKILFGCSRGLFFASPVLLAAPHGLWRLWKEKRFSGAALVAAGIVTYYFLFNASFYWWKAGLTFGPRYAGAAIPLLCLGLAVSWSRASLAWRWVIVALACCSVFVALMVVSTSSQLAMQDSCPIMHSSWPAFWAGKMAMNRESMLTVAEASGGYGAFNLGQLIGLHGLASLIPLLAMWGVLGGIWMRFVRER